MANRGYFSSFNQQKDDFFRDLNTNDNINDFFNDKAFIQLDKYFDNTGNDGSKVKIINYTIGDENNQNHLNFYKDSGDNDGYKYNYVNKPRYHIGWQDPKTKTLQPKFKDAGKRKLDDIAPTTEGLISKEDMEAKYLDQDYSTIKRKCLLRKALWEDETFPANMTSLFPSGNSGGWRDFEWKRPGEICKNPRMFVDGHKRFDVTQGELGNCWFLAATACLCTVKNHELFERVVPRDNNNVYVGNDYAGIFKFNIWQYGRWTEVVIDDRLPTKNGRLVFVHSDNNNEFWPALLEKAYAKINGSYEALQGGSVGEAMVDFTGGIVNPFNLTKEVPDDFFSLMKQAFDRDSLLGCSIDPQIVGGDIEGRLYNGLITGHAYSITGLRMFNLGYKKVQLVRVRNPWGNEEEWKGAWSDNSTEWRSLSDSEKKSLELNFEEDGEFWISFEDFINNFTHVDVCMAAPRHLTKTPLKLCWETTSYEGSWKRGLNAGGCRNHLETFSTNPQYIIEVIDPDENNDVNEGTVFIALLQKDRRKIKQQSSYCSAYLYKQQHQPMLTIGYYIYKLPEDYNGILDINFFKYNLSTSKSPSFTNVREMVGRHKLVPGKYAVIPSTFKPNQEGDYLLRIFSEKSVGMKEADELTGFIDNPSKKVKEDMPIYGDSELKPGDKGLKGMVPADSEIKRAKTQLITPEDVNESKDIDRLFKKISDDDMEVDAYGLQSILDEKFKPEFKFDGFELETTRSMVAMMDADHSGKLGHDEFKQLWKDIRFWKKVFVQYNNSSLSTLGSFELRSALNSSGFLTSNQTLKCLSMRYADRNGLIYFNDFVHLAVRLKTMFAIYQDLSRNQIHPPMMTLDQFIQTTMYS